MEPIYIICNTELEAAWPRTASRDGLNIPLIEICSTTVRKGYSGMEQKILCMQRSSQKVSLDLSQLSDDLKRRAENILLSSGAICNIPVVCYRDALYRCPSGLIHVWVDWIHKIDSQVKLDSREYSGKELFYHGTVTCPSGNHVEFTSGAAIDPVKLTACEYIEIELCRSWFMQESDHQFLMKLLGRLNNLGGQPVIVMGVFA